MNIKDWLEAIKTRTFFLALTNVTFIILPGVTFVFVLFPVFFENLSSLKIILLSASVTAPLALFNTAILTKGLNNIADDEYFVDFSSGVILAGLSLYGGLIGIYLLSKSGDFGFQYMPDFNAYWVILAAIALDLSLLFEGVSNNKRDETVDNIPKIQ
jgi:hypothetical protein